MRIILLDRTCKLMWLGVCLSNLGMLIQLHHREVLEDKFSLVIKIGRASCRERV